MYPILLSIGPLTIYSLWIFLAIAIFCSLLVVNKLAKSRLVKLSFLAEKSLLIFFSGLIISRLFFIIYNLDYFWDAVIVQGHYLELFYIWDKGLSAWGGLLGIFLSIFILCRIEKEDFLAWSDIMSISVLFGMFFADIGAFLDGRNYGSPTDLPWGVLIEPSQYAIPIHPVQLYAAAYSLLIGIILFHFFNNKLFKASGGITFAGLTAYCFFRFLEEFLRGDETILYFGLIREAQFYSLIGLLIGGYLLYRYFRKYIHENR